MTDKLYTVAGTSTLNGETKARFANDTMRIKVLAKNGHTDIMLVELPKEMTKVEAAQFISGLPEFSGEVEQEAIGEYLGKHTPKAKVVVKKAVKAAVVTKPAKAPKVTAPTVDEDAPF